MEAVRIPCPEFDRARHDPESRPERRPRNGSAIEAAGCVRHALLESRAIAQLATLCRCPRADLKLAWPRREVRVRLCIGRALDRSLDAHLFAERRPVEAQRR